MRQKFVRFCTPLLLLGLINTTGCDHNRPTPDSHLSEDEDQWEKARWIQKTVAKLRYGKPIQNQAEMDRFLAMEKQAILDELMGQTEFGDTTLDFNLYFLGSKPNQVKSRAIDPDTFEPTDSYSYDQVAVSKPQAIAAARAVVEGGDYFKLFDYEQTYYLPLSTQSFLDGSMDPDPDARDDRTDKETRAVVTTLINNSFDEILAAFGPDDQGTYNKEAGCLAFSSGGQEKLQQLISGLGAPTELQFPFFVAWQIDINESCGNPEVPGSMDYQLMGQLRDRFAILIDLATSNTVDQYPVQSIVDLKPFDATTIDDLYLGNRFGAIGFWNTYMNSSTNYNRRRAAYILKTYFCDDLTPVDVAEPDDHAGGDAHASDRGCQGCHYKLDPMAGFFRYAGFFGRDSRIKTYHLFDDSATLDTEARQEYWNTWKAPDDSDRTWNVGFMRDNLNDRLNTYIEDDEQPLKSLFEYIRTEPRVKQCLTRKMAEYYLGEEQMVDGAWIDQLAETFEEEENSAAAFKKVTGKIFLSNTFMVQDPDPDQCYDRVDTDSDMDETTPCLIQYIFETHCSTCHDSFDFENQDELKEIKDRLTTGDSSIRMPKNKAMPDPMRIKFVNWLDEKIVPDTEGEDGEGQ